LLRRVFCDTKCKNEFGRRKIENKHLTICVVCGTSVHCFKSELNSTKYCSVNCRNLSQKKLSDKICKFCKKVYQSHPSRINEYYCSRYCYQKDGITTKFCVTCGKSFEAKKSGPNVRCSRECQYIDQSNGKIKVYTNGRSGHRKDISPELYFKSALEADFARVMNHQNIDYEYEKRTFSLLGKKYTPDFYLPEFQIYIELKGVELNGKKFNTLMSRNLTNHNKLKEQNIKILTVTQKEFILVMRELGLWNELSILELRNYRKNKDLVSNYENKANNKTKL